MVFLGPIAIVTLSRPVLKPEDIQQASSIQIKMLVDTGASKTVVDRGIAESLGLEPIRFEPMIGMSTPPTPRPFNGLLGRDFLRFVHLSYDGPAGHCDIVGNSPDGTAPYSHGAHTGNKNKRKQQRTARKKNRR